MNLLLSTLFAAAMAQASPAAHADFSGAWMLDTTRSETFLAGGAVERGPIVIARSGARFTITPVGDSQPETVTSAVEDSAPLDNSGAPYSSTYWQGRSMITDRYESINGRAVTVRQSRTLERGGSEMVVETTVAIHHGYAEGEPLPQSTARDVYVRAAR